MRLLKIAQERQSPLTGRMGRGESVGCRSNILNPMQLSKLFFLFKHRKVADSCVFYIEKLLVHPSTFKNSSRAWHTHIYIYTQIRVCVCVCMYVCIILSVSVYFSHTKRLQEVFQFIRWKSKPPKLFGNPIQACEMRNFD